MRAASVRELENTPRQAPGHFIRHLSRLGIPAVKGDARSLRKDLDDLDALAGEIGLTDPDARAQADYRGSFSSLPAHSFRRRLSAARNGFTGCSVRSR